MISKNDIILLLTEMQSSGIDVKEDINLVIKSPSIPLQVLKKINSNKSLDALEFYEKIRKSYNSKKSKLYINIMRSDEQVIDDPKIILTTLTSLLNQILLYKPNDRTMFYSHVRCDEIIKVLDIYFKSYNLEPALQLLKLFKADIRVLEMIK